MRSSGVTTSVTRMPKSSSITTTSPRARRLPLTSDVDRLARMAVELQDRALTECQELANRQRRAAELDGDRERDLEQQPDVGVGGRVVVERDERLELDVLDHRLGRLPGGRSLLQEQLLDRRLVESVGELAELRLDGCLDLRLDLLDLLDVHDLLHVLDGLDGLVVDDLLLALRVVGHWIANPVK